MAKLTTPILLQIQRDGQESRVEEFNEHIIKVGKLSSVNLRLDDPNVNRIHAVIEVTAAEEAQIIDMGSSKGTRVNEKRIHKAKLVSGDVIQLGDTFITIHIGESAVEVAKGGGADPEPPVEDSSPVAMEPVEMDHDVEGTVVGPAPVAPVSSEGEDASTQVAVEAATPSSDVPEEDTAAVTPEQAAIVHQAIAAAAVSSQEEDPAPSASTQVAQAAVDYEQHGEDVEGGTVVSQIPQVALQGAQEVTPAQAPEPVAQPQPAQASEPVAQPQPAQPQPAQASAPVAQPQQQPQQAWSGAPEAAFASHYSQTPQQDPNAAAMAAAGQQVVQHSQPAAFAAPMAQQAQYPGGFAQSQAPAQAWQQPNMYAQQAGMPSQPAISAPSPSLSRAPAVSSADYADSQEALEVKVIWGNTILDHNHFYEPKRITIGESRKNTFSLSSEALPDVESFALIETEGDRLLINFTDQMGGELHLKDQIVPLAQIKQSAKVQQTALGYQFALPAQSRVRLFVGELVFEISFVPAPKRLPPAVLSQMDHHLARSMGTSFLIHGVLILLMLFADVSPGALDDDFFKQNNRFAQMIVRPEEPEKKKKKKQSGGAKAKGKKGKMGKKKNATNKKRKAGQKKKNPDATAPIDMDKNVEKEVLDRLKKKGMLGLLAGGGSRAGGLITAKGFGGDDANALGGWQGSKVGSALGAGGLGRGGVGAGGGGMSGDSVGIGRVGTYGRGGGKGGRGWGRSKLRNKRRRKITVSTGPPAIYGGLDKEIIRRIINQHRSRFKYCYERELIKRPTLQGKIHVWFQIEGTGRVHKSRISRTTMNNDRVEECLSRRVRLLRFPSPKGGGVVHVNYPFIFRPS